MCREVDMQGELCISGERGVGIWGWEEISTNWRRALRLGGNDFDLCDSYRDLISLIWIGDSDLSKFILYKLYKKRYRSPRG